MTLSGNQKAVKHFAELLETTDALLGPEGCPWDREQTLVSMRESILEEACEVIEAIDEGSDADLVEELGDLLYNILFFCKLGEKEGRFSTAEPVENIRHKLIARHPHVFGGKKLQGSEAVISQWEQIKKEEKSHRESLLDGIPKGLPALARAYKIAKKIEKVATPPPEQPSLFETEEELGKLLWHVVQQARLKKFNPEMALRKEMVDQEQKFRVWEKERTDASTP